MKADVTSLEYTMHMIFRLPFPPSVNTYWRNYRGRMVLSARGRDYKKKVYEDLSGERTFLKTPLAGRLRVVVDIYVPDKRRRDIDNCAKALLDAIGDAEIYEDDSQIDELLLRRAPIDRPDGHVMIFIEELTVVGRLTRFIRKCGIWR